MDAAGINDGLAEVGAVARVAYPLRDVPRALAMLTPTQVREHGVAMLVDGVTLGDWSVKDLALALNALRDGLLARSDRALKVRARTTDAGDRNAIELVRVRIAARGYCPWSAVHSWAKMRPDSFFTDAGFEIVSISILRSNGKWYTIERALVPAGAQGGPKWKRIGGGT